MGINEHKKVLLFVILILINAGAVQYTTFLSQLIAVRATSVN